MLQLIRKGENFRLRFRMRFRNLKPDHVWNTLDDIELNDIPDYFLDYREMAELARQIGISKRKILDNINKLKEQNLLRRVGENKTGYWEVL